MRANGNYILPVSTLTAVRVVIGMAALTPNVCAGWLDSRSDSSEEPGAASPECGQVVEGLREQRVEDAF